MGKNGWCPDLEYYPVGCENGWFNLGHVFTSLMSIVNIGRLSEKEKDLEIWVLRQQLALLQRKCDKPVKPNRAEKMTLAILAAKLKQATQRPTN